jgi:hypothetical protein
VFYFQVVRVARDCLTANLDPMSIDALVLIPRNLNSLAAALSPGAWAAEGSAWAAEANVTAAVAIKIGINDARYRDTTGPRDERRFSVPAHCIILGQ